MKTAKKIISILLAAVMVCSIVAFATEPTAPTEPTEPYVKSYTINAICDNSSKWDKYHLATSTNLDSTKYPGTAGKGNSEIVSGNYVDLTLTVADAATTLDFNAPIAVSIPGDSNFRGGKNMKAAISNATDGYTLTLEGVYYADNTDNTLKILVTQDSYNAVLTCEIQNATVVPASSVQDEPITDYSSAQPYVIISSYSYGKGDLVAGESRNITMTFSNTSPTLAVENMMVTMTLPADAMMLTSSSNSFYVERLEAGKSITKTVNVTVKPTAKVESHSISVNFSYDYLDYGTRKSTSTEESVTIPVVQVDRFTMTGVEMDDYLFANEEGSLSVGFVNKGRSDVYNISAKLSCEGLLNNGEEQYLGNLASGTASSADFYITPMETGTLTGEVIITYEDTNMQERTVTVPFTAEVTSYEDMYGPMDPFAPGFEDPGFEDPGMNAGGFPWYWIVLGVAAVGGGVFAVIRSRKKKASEVEDEDI